MSDDENKNPPKTSPPEKSTSPPSSEEQSPSYGIEEYNPKKDTNKEETPINGNGGGHDENKYFYYPQRQPLQREIPDRQEYPIDALGSMLNGAALKAHEVIQAPLAICGQSFLAAATLAVQPYADLEIDGRICPLSNNFITIGESGERKTACDKLALAPIFKRQKYLLKKYGPKFNDYDDEMAAWKKTRDQALSSSKNKTLKEKKDALMHLGPPPESPISPIMIVDEPTYEGMIKAFVNGWPSVGLFNDDAGQFIGGHAMNKENQLKTLAGFSKLWDGATITRTRAGDGNYALYGRRFSLHLMIQPVVSSILFKNDLFTQQGFLNRCLCAFPESEIGNRKYKGINLNEADELIQYSRMMVQILETDLPLTDGTKNELNPRKISMNAKAKAEWERFVNHVEKLCKPGEHFSPAMGFVSKAGEHLGRIAGVLALTENLDAGEIKIEPVEAGIALVEYYISDKLRLGALSMSHPDLLLAEKLLEWSLIRNKPIYPVLVYTFGPRPIRNKATAERIIKILLDHGQFRQIRSGAKIDNIFRNEVYEVVP